MDFPSHYLAVKPIFDLSLFGIEDAEGHFSSNETLAFSQEFLSYQKEFLANDGSGDHELLLHNCFRYLSNVPKNVRRDIIKVIDENEPLAEALMLLSMLNDGSGDPEQGNIKFQVGLRTYLEDNKINECIILFFQQHFLNLGRIEPTNYENFELSRAEYLLLVSDYLQIQSQIF